MVYLYPYIYIIMIEFFFVLEKKFWNGHDNVITILDRYNFLLLLKYYNV